MNKLKHAFIEFALENQALIFGQFTLKSGRISPYFFNAGQFYKGAALAQLGQFYAQTILKHSLKPDILFGPAYKGIPIVSSSAIALEQLGQSVSISFNRKEVKDHGEGGVLLAAPLKDKNVLMLDDVITAGTSYRESRKLIEQAGGKLSAMLIALDRAEKGQGSLLATEEIQNQGIPVYSIADFDDLLQYLALKGEQTHLKALKDYQHSMKA